MRSHGLAACLILAACGGDPSPVGPCGSFTEAAGVARGSDVGHLDPGGARAAGQARAGRISDLSIVKRPADARHPVEVGDYLLANDKIAVYIEGARPSYGYKPYGGEIVALETYGPDGLPRGTSEYGETLMVLGGQVIAPESVTVIADGSDGGPAIVRSEGPLRSLPFMKIFSGLFGNTVASAGAVDYVLAPGEARVQIRLHLLNTSPAVVSTEGADLLGFFHSYRGGRFSDVNGFGPVDGLSSGWVGWDAGASAFAIRRRAGTIKYLFEESGFELFLGAGATLPACQETVLDYAELIAADDLDGLVETIHQLDGLPAGRAIAVEVKDGAGVPLPGAYVHVTRADGTYLSRALVGSDGRATLHASGAVTLYATAAGYDAPSSIALTADETSASFTFGQNGLIDVDAKEVGSGAALPVRVVVLPMTPLTASPATFGVSGEAFGRSHQVFAETGRAQVQVPVGMHRVVVSRGLEYEIDDRTVDVAAGATVKIDAQLERSIDTTSAMCTDFHVHSFYSVDAPDPVETKVRSVLAEGLDIAISSEHEYVIDFQPVLEQLGMTKWAHGLPSEELTTFLYGHFGVVPKVPNPESLNRGAVDWTGHSPAETFGLVRALPEQPALIVNHPYSETFQGYFTAGTFDVDTATGDPSMYSDDFDAIEVTNDSDFARNRNTSIAAWFSLLNHGKRVFGVGSSDSHRLRTEPVGYPRTYLLLGHDDPAKVTPEAVRDAVKQGQAVVSGGLYLTVVGPGGVRPGGNVTNASGKLAFDVAVQAPSWIAADSLEVIVDGVTTQTITLVPSVVAGPGQRWEAPVEIDVPAALPPGGTHWVVFHANGKQDLSPVHPGRKAFGFSNPIFF